MDYRKLDAALATELEEVQDVEERALAVFIHTSHAPRDTEANFLRELGVHEVTLGQQVFTATLSARAVAELSRQPWVRYLKLSRKLRLLSKPNQASSVGEKSGGDQTRHNESSSDFP